MPRQWQARLRQASRRLPSQGSPDAGQVAG